MKVFYSPETDSLSIKLQTGDQEIAGEIMGEDLNGARTLYDAKA